MSTILESLHDWNGLRVPPEQSQRMERRLRKETRRYNPGQRHLQDNCSGRVRARFLQVSVFEGKNKKMKE